MKTVYAMILVAIGALTMSTSAHADWGRHDWGHDRWDNHHYYNHGYVSGSFVSVGIPHGFINVSIGGRPYFYHNGGYYERRHSTYVLVPSPVVVEQPVVIQQPNIVTTPVVVQDSFPVNIPNSSGGYTAVTLRRSGSGFVGPQGEYYSEFPRLEQLRAMYVN